MDKKPKRPRDSSQLAKKMEDIASGEAIQTPRSKNKAGVSGRRLKAWSLEKGRVSFTPNLTGSLQLCKTLVTIEALGNIKTSEVKRQFEVTRERYRFDQAEQISR